MGEARPTGGASSDREARPAGPAALGAGLRREVARTAITSRAAVIMVAVASRAALDPYDSSAALRHAPGAARWLALGTNWDAEYFTSIAESGYRYEQMHAFFPLVPGAMRAGGGALHSAVEQIAGDAIALGSCQIAAGLVAVNLCFVLAAVALFDLTVQIWPERGENFAYRAAIIFCFTPASVFMSALYTEAPFALLSFWGMRLASRAVHTGIEVDLDLWKASALFALATLSRSNGAVLAGYLGYRILRPFLIARRPPSLGALAAASLRLAGPGFVAVVLPLGAVLGYAARLYCSGLDGSEINPALRRPAPGVAPRPWCLKSVPNVYSFVQEEYWNQGFLRFYRVEQIPNFLLAAPSLAWAAQSVRWALWQHKVSAKEFALLPFALHLGFLAVFCALCMHVQVATRFLSACPLLYWYAADSPAAQWFIVPWGCVYLVLGTALFSCYYPFV